MRPEKNLILDEVRGWVNGAPFLIVADYTGLKVSEFSELRVRLRAVKAEVHVVKNTFVKKVLSEASLPDLNGSLQGQTAVVFGDADVCATAKILKNFNSEFKKPKIRIGVLDKAVIDEAGILALADLPAKEVLLAKLLGLLNAPATKLARLIQTPAGQLAQVIKANSEKGA